MDDNRPFASNSRRLLTQEIERVCRCLGGSSRQLRRCAFYGIVGSLLASPAGAFKAAGGEGIKRIPVAKVDLDEIATASRLRAIPAPTVRGGDASSWQQNLPPGVVVLGSPQVNSANREVASRELVGGKSEGESDWQVRFPAEGQVVSFPVSEPVGATAPVWQVVITNPPAPSQPAQPITILNVPEAKSEAGDKLLNQADQVVARRERIAESVSRSVLTGGAKRSSGLVGQGGGGAGTPTSESVTTTQMLRQSEELLREAELALRRGAAYTAKEAALGGLRAIAAANDAQQGGSYHSDLLRKAIDAVREAGDFVGRYGNADSEAIARMAISHQTPVLKNVGKEGLTPHAAADRYLDFARENFTAAAAGRTSATALLRVLANAEKAARGNHSEFANSIVLCYLRAAVATDIDDSSSLNELGYYAMQVGLLQESQWALERSIALLPSTSAVQNLIEVHRLAGNLDRAKELVSMLPQGGGEARSLTVTPVASEDFVAISRPVQMAASPSFASPSSAAPVGVTGERPVVAPSGIAQGDHGGVRATNGNSEVSTSGISRLTGSLKSIWK